MIVVNTFGQLTTYQPAATAGAIVLPTRLSLSHSSPETYAALYRTQPNVRTCCDFLGRNLAQIGIHTYRRVSDTDRERLVDHQIARWLSYPNPATTRYRLIESTIIDLAIFFSAYWLKVRRTDGEIGLVRLPPQQMHVEGWLMPSWFGWTLDNGQTVDIAPSEIVYFTGYDPDNALQGLSPLETLRGILEEEQAASDYRATYFENSARMEGVIERPVTAPKWTREQKDDWRTQFAARYAGPANQGKVPVLEDGMIYKPIAHSARESEFVDARKLTREEVAAAYHIPAPMVGILDHATFCLPGDAEVFTAEGPRRIAEVREGDWVWSLSAADSWLLSPVTHSACTGLDEILTIRTPNREVRLNARHRVLARRAVLEPAPVAVMADGHRRALGRARKRWITEYVPAGDLRVGDTIVSLKRLPAAEEASTHLPSGRRATIGFLEVCGLLLGDGNVTRVKGDPVGLQIARAETAPYMDAYRATLRAEFDATLPGTRAPLHLIEGHRQTRLMSVTVGRELDRLGLSGTARTKRVPGWVFGLPEAYRLALLRGFLDADGSCDKRGRLSFSSCSRPLLSQIRHLCLSVGVPVTNLHEQRGVTRLPTGRMANFAQWTFTCSDPGANRRIGSHTPVYQQRLADGQPFDRKGSRYPWQGGRGFTSETTQLSAIVAVTRSTVHEPVYDLEVAVTHSFIADGVVVHNSNIREQHKELYADCLGPWTVMVEEELDRQLLPECDDTDNIYNEFNIAEKLKGSFEEQALALRTLVGRPVMTANEGRARLNLPSIKDDPTADQLAMPLNTMTGQSMPAAPPQPLLDTSQMAGLSSVLAQTWTRQQARIEKEPNEPFDLARWDKELATDLLDVFRQQGLDDADAMHRAMRLAARINTDTMHRLTAGLELFPVGREAAYG
jgi:HK97 family phage portal protein